MIRIFVNGHQLNNSKKYVSKNCLVLSDISKGNQNILQIEKVILLSLGFVNKVDRLNKHKNIGRLILSRMSLKLVI